MLRHIFSCTFAYGCIFIWKNYICDHLKKFSFRFRRKFVFFKNKRSRQQCQILCSVQANACIGGFYSVRVHEMHFITKLTMFYNFALESFFVFRRIFKIRRLTSEFHSRGAARYLIVSHISLLILPSATFMPVDNSVHQLLR